MTADVLDEDEAGSEYLGEALDVGPEVSLVCVLALLACDGEWLTRDAASDAIHDSSPRARVEGGEVAPDRRRIQGSFFHAADQY